jgi:integrase/recombinase XerD
MKVSEAGKLFLGYHKAHSKENSVRAYNLVLNQLLQEFGTEDLEGITTERILSFLNRIVEGKKPQTKRTRYSHLMAFFNFIKNNLDPDFRNPCDTPMLKKLFRSRGTFQWGIIEKETVDEIIFRTSKTRIRLMLELMARGGMRISEVLKLTPSDINEGRLTLRDPKSGRDQEFSSSLRDSRTGSKTISGKWALNPSSVFPRYVMRPQGKWWPKRVAWWGFISGPMTCGVMRRPLQVVLAFR